jgi:hypothetical protein
MPAAAIIGGVASLGSALIGRTAAKKAAKMQAQAAREGIDAQMRMFETARGDLAPFRMAGEGATASLAQLYGIDPLTGQLTGQPFPEGSLEAFRRSPDYEFARSEGLRGINFRDAGTGQLRSGNNLRDLVSFNQGLATQNFNNYRGALQQLASMGQGAAGASAGQAIQTGQGVAAGLNQAGAANASGVVGSANAWGSALGNIGNFAMLQSLMRPQTSAYGGGGGALQGWGGVGAFPY